MKLILPLLLILPVAACKKRTDIAGDSESSLSSVKIGKFVPPEGSAEWANMNVKVIEIKEDNTENPKEFSFANDSFDENADVIENGVELELTYGSYKFLLTFTSAEGKVVYETCDKENLAPELIAEPEASIVNYICGPEGAIVGSISPKNLEIETKIEASDASLASAGTAVTAAFTKHCVSCHVADSSGPEIDLVKLAAIDAFELRTKSLAAIENGSMPKNPSADWDADKDDFVKNLKCLEDQSQSSCTENVAE